MGTTVTTYFIQGWKIPYETAEKLDEEIYIDLNGVISRNPDVKLLMDGMNGAYAYIGNIQELFSDESIWDSDTDEFNINIISLENIKNLKKEIEKLTGLSLDNAEYKTVILNHFL
jgi:hypothetical protein